MKNFILKFSFIFIFLIHFSDAFSQIPQLSENAKISVLTCGTGNESYSLFGHTGVRITDEMQHIDVVYNYGAFDFSTPNFITKFTKGDLQYFVAADFYTDFVNQYLYEKRSIYEQELNIPLASKQKVFDYLNQTLYSNDKYYTYKFIDKNCTTMVVDLLNKNLGNIILPKTNVEKITYRSILYPYFENQFYYKLGTSIIFGNKVDQVSNTIFLPFELLDALKTAKFQNHLLCNEVKPIVAFKNEPPLSWWNNVYSYILLLNLIVFLNKKSIDFIYLSIISLFGIFFFSVGFYSFHHELANNYNILLFNPTLLLFLYFIYKNNKKWILNLGIFNLLSLVIYLIIVVTKAPFLIVLPLMIANAIIVGKYLYKLRKQTTIDLKS